METGDAEQKGKGRKRLSGVTRKSFGLLKTEIGTEKIPGIVLQALE